jgi:integrase
LTADTTPLAGTVFGLLIYAGLRRNEGTSLRFLDVNLDAGTVLA